MLSFAGLVIVVGACASVPKESVELSVTVGRDLSEVHRANRTLALKYFERMRQDVDRFVEEVYRPYIIRETIAPVVTDIQAAAAAPNDSLDPVDIMDVYSEEVLAQVDSFHRAMLKPIEEQEVQVIGAIDDAFQRLQNANAIVTGHLASIRKVRDAQVEFLGEFGQQDLTEKVAGTVAGLSESLASILAEGSKVEELLDSGPSKLCEAQEKLDGILKNVQRLGPSTDVTRK